LGAGGGEGRKLVEKEDCVKPKWTIKGSGTEEQGGRGRKGSDWKAVYLGTAGIQFTVGINLIVMRKGKTHL